MSTDNRPELAELAKPGFYERKSTQTGIMVLIIVVLAALGMTMDLSPDLSRLDNRMLSGSERGNYHAIVQELAATAKKRGGKLENVTSKGSGDNLAQLVAAADGCDVHYALVQDGLDWPDSDALELMGRLRKAETVFFLGRSADRISSFKDLRGLRVGIGPRGSGSAYVATRILTGRDFEPLKLVLSAHPLAEQLALLKAGKLDLGVFIIDEDAELVDGAVREQGLQIASFPNIDVLARKLAFARKGRIGAGQYDPVNLIPATDKLVLRIDTLVVGNGCGTRSEDVALLSTLAETFPDFLEHNDKTMNTTGLPLAQVSKDYFENQGPDFVEKYLPWVVDIMPVSNWITVFIIYTVLVRLMGETHRFRLWRIDANRVKAERILSIIFGPQVSARDVDVIATMVPNEEHLAPERRRALNTCIAQLEALWRRTRKQSVGLVVPMSQEMPYRYQEAVIGEMLHALVGFRQRLQAFEQSGDRAPA